MRPMLKGLSSYINLNSVSITFFLPNRNYTNFLPLNKEKRVLDRIVPYTASQYFDVVIDVDKYHTFLPWCRKSRIISENLKSDNNFEAELYIGNKLLQDRYISKVSYIRPNYIKAVATDSSIFSSLITEWSFKPCSKSHFCYLKFSIEFQFSSRLYQYSGSYFIDQMSEVMTKSFEEQVSKLHGNDCNSQEFSKHSPMVTNSVNFTRETNQHFDRVKENTAGDKTSSIHTFNHHLISFTNESSFKLTLSQWSKLFQKVNQFEKQSDLSKVQAIFLKNLIRRRDSKVAKVIISLPQEYFIESIKEYDHLLLALFKKLTQDS